MEHASDYNLNIEPQKALSRNYAAVLHALRDLVFVLDKNRVFIDSFQPSADHLYIPPEAFLNKKITEIPFPVLVLHQIQEKLDQFEIDNIPSVFEYSLDMPSGKCYYQATISGIFAKNNKLESFVLAVHDITKRVEQQNAFIAILEKYNLAVKAAHLGVWEFDYLTNSYYWDEAMEKMFNQKVANGNDLRTLWSKLVQPGEYDNLRQQYKDARKTGNDFHAIFNITVSLKPKYIETYATFKYNNETNTSEKVTGITIDITEKKLAEIELQKSEYHYRMLADNMVDTIVLLTPGMQRIYVSPSAKGLTGYTPEELLKLNVNNIIHPDDVERLEQTLQRTIYGNENHATVSYRIQHKDGFWVYVEVVLKAIRRNDGTLENILALTRDITRQQMAENALRASEFHYRMLADNIVDMVTLLTPDLHRVYVSPSALALTGYEPAELLKSTVYDFVHQEDLALIKQTLKDTTNNKVNHITISYRIRHKDGHIVHVEVVLKAIRDGAGKLLNLLATTRDISRQQVAENALRASEEQYRLLADNSADLIMLLTPELKRIYVSPSCQKLTGYTQQEFLKTTINDIIHPDDAKPFKQKLENTIYHGQNQVTISYKVQHKNGSWIWMEAIFKAIRNEKGGLINILASTRDISRQQQAELAVRASEEKYRLLADNIVDMVVLLSPAFRVQFMSPSSFGLIGYTPAELIGEEADLNVFYSDDDREIAESAIIQMIHGVGPGIAQFSFRHKNGNRVIVEGISKIIHDEAGQLKNFLVSVRNIGKQVKAEIALRSSEQQYRMLADNIVDMVMLFGIDHKKLYVSPSCFALTGYTVNELLYTAPQINLFYSSADIDSIQACYARLSAGLAQDTIQFSYRHKNGNRVMIEGVLKSIKDAKGRIKNYLFVARDITRAIQAEQALKKSNDQYRMLADNIVDMVLLLAPDFTRLYVSPSCYGLTGYTHQEFISLQRQLNVFYSHADQEIVREAQLKILSHSSIEIVRYNLLHKNGRKVTVEAIVKGIFGQSGIESYLLTIRDVTQQEEIKNALRKSEEQYRMLANNIVDMVVLITPGHGRVYISPSSLLLIGYTPAELLGNLRELSVFYSGEDETILRAAEKQIEQGRDQAVAQYSLKHKMGSRVFVEGIIKGIRDNKGVITNFLLTVRNISRQVEAEHALRKSEEQYRMLADNMTDLVVLFDANVKIIYVSPSCLAVTGYTPEELTSLERPALIYHADLEAFDAFWMNNIRNGVDYFKYEFRGIHKNGHPTYMASEFKVIRNKNSHVVNVLVTMKNIHAEKTAQIALKENEEKYRSLVEASEDVILIVDETGKYLFANEIAGTYLQQNIANVIGNNMHDFCEKQVADDYVYKIRQVLDSGGKLTYESANPMHGKTFWFRNTLIPIFDAASNAYAVMLCIVDITDIKSYSETLVKQNKELKQIAYLQSHVVRAPLANIEALVNLLNECEVNEQSRQYIDLLREAALQLDGVIKQIVDKAIEVKQD